MTDTTSDTAARTAAIQAVEQHPSTTFMAPCESLADAVLTAAAPHLEHARDEVIIAWLLKKAAEFRASSGWQAQTKADVIETMADKIRRGAARKDNLRAPAPASVDGRNVDPIEPKEQA